MGNIGLNHKYLRNNEKIMKEGQLPAQGIAITYLMMGTGVYRLYTKEDFFEFLKRLSLLYKRINIPENFLLDGYILSFSTGEEKIFIQTNDLTDYMGSSFSQRAIKNRPFDKWLHELDKSISNCILVSILNGYSLFEEYYEKSTEPVVDGGEITLGNTFRVDKTPMQITSVDIVNAERIAKIILKDIPDEAFLEWASCFPEALSIYDKEANKKPSLVFDYDLLPDETKGILKEHFLQFFTDEEYSEKFKIVKKLIYLAWFYANNLMVVENIDGYDWYEPDSLYEFDETGIECSDGGLNYEVIREEYYLDDIFHFLKVK